MEVHEPDAQRQHVRRLRFHVVRLRFHVVRLRFHVGRPDENSQRVVKMPSFLSFFPSRGLIGWKS